MAGFADILKDLEKSNERKLRTKLPDWAEHFAELSLPTSLSLEQCSSTLTAQYKVSLLDAYLPEGQGVVCDLTGGLGVDSMAFARRAALVHYFEMQPQLAEAMKHNSAVFGLSNIDIHCQEVGLQTQLPECDVVYADPARRSSSGSKVFLLEDCTPNILPMLPQLLQSSKLVMLKLAPMADISMLCKRLGQCLKELHVVSARGEVRELLCLLEKGHQGEAEIIVTELSECKKPEECRLLLSQERDAALQLADSVSVGDTLLVPSAALMKAGAFKLISRQWGARKLDVSTHLYLQSSDQEPPHAFFSAYQIEQVLEFGKAAMRQLATQYPKAEVIARNMPLSSDALAAKMKIKRGGDVFIFACKTKTMGEVFLVTKKKLIFED